MTTTTSALTFSGEPLIEDRVSERRFEVTRGGEAIPGILWTPAARVGAAPLVLLGHGGSGHKRNDRMLELGVRSHAIAASPPRPSTAPATATAAA